MSVPGRIEIILIVALAIVDAVILASGARQATSEIQTGALIREAAPVETVGHDTLLATAMREIGILMAKPTVSDEPLGI